MRPSLKEYCSHIWGAAVLTTFSILDAVQRRQFDSSLHNSIQQQRIPVLELIITSWKQSSAELLDDVVLILASAAVIVRKVFCLL
nr:unnamed protein product [Callosobruchus chinensis]